MRYFVGLWILMSLLAASCAITTPTQFYVLTAVPSSAPLQRLPGDKRNLTISIGPVELPGYLDRPQIATRLSPTTLHFSEFHQWAEPLKDSVTRVLAENLSHLLATDYVVSHPWTRSTAMGYQVQVYLTYFEGMFGDQSLLKARWHILDTEAQEELIRQTSSFTAPANTEDYETMVAAMSQTLEKLSHDIAVALRALAQNPPPTG